MGEEVEMKDYPELDNDKDRVFEWEDGLPSTNDLTPLSHALISPQLASAFSISPEPSRTMIDVNRASQTTFSNLRKQNQGFLMSKFKSLPSFQEIDPVLIEGYEPESEENEEKDGSGSGSGSGCEKRKLQTLDNTEEAFQTENSNEDNTTRALKRPRLVWTPQLHKRFVEVVAHLGIKNAVPKTIMQLMNVEGLTRENVASHLQKYRLYLKRMQGLSDEGPSPSDQLFASTPVPPSLNESVGAAAPVPTMPVRPVPVPMPYGHPLMPMPVLGMPHGGTHMGMPSNVGYHGFNPHHYNMYREQQRDWSGNRFGSVMSQHHVSHHTK